MWSVTLLTPYRDENVEDTMSRIYRKVRYEFNIAVKKGIWLLLSRGMFGSAPL